MFLKMERVRLRELYPTGFDINKIHFEFHAEGDPRNVNADWYNSTDPGFAELEEWRKTHPGGFFMNPEGVEVEVDFTEILGSSEVAAMRIVRRG